MLLSTDSKSLVLAAIHLPQSAPRSRSNATFLISYSHFRPTASVPRSSSTPGAACPLNQNPTHLSSTGEDSLYQRDSDRFGLMKVQAEQSCV